MALSRRTGTRFQGSIWPGFVDAMTGLLLVLMFVLTIFMVVQFVLTERITGQETELDVLSGEVAALAQALGLEERDNAQLAARLGALNSSLGNAQDRLSEQEALIASLTQERDQQAASLQTAQGQITQFEAQVAGLLADQERDVAAIADLEGREARLLSDQEALNLALTSARTEIDAQTEAARLAAARREALDALIANLRSRNADSSAKVSDLLALGVDAQGQIAELNARNAEADTLVANLRTLNAETEAQLAELDTRNVDSETLIAELRAGLENAQTQNALLRAQLDTGAEALTAEETARLVEAAAAQALRARLADADAELTAMTLALEARRKEAEDTLTLLAAARAATGDLDVRLAETLLRLQAAETNAETGAVAQTDLATAQQEIAALQTALIQQEAASQREIAALRATLTDQSARADQEIATLRAVLTDQGATADGEITSLQAALAAQEAAALRDITALRAEFAERETADQLEIASLRAALADQGATTQDLSTERAALRANLAAAIAARLAAESAIKDQSSDAERQAILLAAARTALADEESVSAEAQRQTELLNQQVAALRTQLGNLQSLLDDAVARDAAQSVELQSLGSELNTALARVAAEERRRAELEAAERARLEAEAKELQEQAKTLEAQTKDLEAQTKDLEQYRSEFFGRLRDVLGTQEGVRIEGDRFVFSSEVLFPPGGAILSREGRGEIAKVAEILRSIADDIPSEIEWVIRVDGHTDDVPLSGAGEFADNWELSQARALSVVKYMINFLAIPPDRLAANGFGQFQPLALGDSSEARAQNRRIELKFTEK